MLGIKNIFSKIPFSNRFERIWKIAQADFKRRYYNDKLGLFWAILNPILRVLVYYFAFTYLLVRMVEGIEVNFAIFLFAGLIFWMAFTEMLKKGMRILITKRYLIENIKLNKIDLYLSNSLAITIAFIFNIIVYLIFLPFFGISISSSILYMPILIFNIFLLGCGASMILSILFLNFRDITHLVDILIMLGFWTSGIIFKAELILEKAPALYYINPFIGIIENVRRITLYSDPINLVTLNINLILGFLMFIIGLNMINKYSQNAMEKL